MYNEESASLVLRVGDLPNGSSNNVGTCDAFHTNMTWNNINLRTLLGDMYDKYDMFALVPVVFASSHANNTFGSTNDDRITQVFISGLPFTNNVYSTFSKTNTNVAFCNNMTFVRQASVVVNGGPVLTFTKNQELVNINIFYQRVSPVGTTTNYTISTNNHVYPNVVFIFKIYGIPKTDRVEDLNSSRMFDKIMY